MAQPSGLYRHFKHRLATGLEGLYRVLTLAQDAEMRTVVVVYQSLHDQRVWVRALDEFSADVQRAEGEEGGPYNGRRFIAVPDTAASSAVRTARRE